MELKIRIKEVKEETMPITLEEKCMFLFSTDMHHSQKIRDEIRKRWDALGLIRCVDSENVLFRVETIRDASPEEIIAWHCVEIYNSCITIDDSWICGVCPRGDKDDCSVKENYDKACELLKGKEVILEVLNHETEN